MLDSWVAFSSLCLTTSDGLFCCVLNFPRIPAPSLSLEVSTCSHFAWFAEAAKPEMSQKQVREKEERHLEVVVMAACGHLWSSVSKHPVCAPRAAGTLTGRQLFSA